MSLKVKGVGGLIGHGRSSYSSVGQGPGFCDRRTGMSDIMAQR